MGRIVVVRRGALQPLDLEMAFEVGAPVLTTIGGAVSLTAPDLVLQAEVGAPVLLSGNVMAANSIEMAVEVGAPALTTSPTISAVNMTSITSTTADWEVVSDAAGGTRYVRVRPSGDTAWTAEQILGSPDGQA